MGQNIAFIFLILILLVSVKPDINQKKKIHINAIYAINVIFKATNNMLMELIENFIQRN